jgi:IS30 family transposase
MSYHHITRENRIEIRTLLNSGGSYSSIGERLGFHPSTIAREISRNLNSLGYYNYEHANGYAKARRHKANQRHRVLSTGSDRNTWNHLTHIIERKIRVQHWSPEQVSGWLKERKKVIIAVQTIYDWIYEFMKPLRKFLHHIRGGYRKTRERYLNKKRRDERKAKKGIDKRPAHIAKRTRYGHWEGDTVLGKGNSGRIATLVERKSGYTIAFLIKRLSGELMRLDEIELEVRRLTVNLRFADGVTDAVNRIVKRQYQKTLTLDNGSENVGYEWIEKGTGLEVFFANAYHSWERGTNENTNGLLRFYFPKDLSFEDITQEDVDKAVNLLNNRPRKRLQYRTPREVFRGCLCCGLN